MKYLRNKDFFRRRKYKCIEHLRLIYRSIIYNRTINYRKRQLVYIKYFKKLGIYSKVKFKNRCNLTFTSRSVSKFFKLSRFKIKDFCLQRNLNGFVKASW